MKTFANITQMVFVSVVLIAIIFTKKGTANNTLNVVIMIMVVVLRYISNIVTSLKVRKVATMQISARFFIGHTMVLQR